MSSKAKKEKPNYIYLCIYVCRQNRYVCMHEDRWSDRHTFEEFHTIKQKLGKGISGDKDYYKFSNELYLTKCSLSSKNNDRMGKPCWVSYPSMSSRGKKNCTQNCKQWTEYLEVIDVSEFIKLWKGN